MLHINHALPLALLMSVSVFAMETPELVWQKGPDGKTLTKVTEATVSKPAMEVTWKKEDGKFVPTEGTQASKPLTQAERPVDLLSTIALSSQYTEQQSVLNRLQREKDAAIQAEGQQLDKLKAMVTDLTRKLGAKQSAEAGSNLAIANFDKEIAKLQALKEAELAIKEQTATDVKTLKASISQTAQDVAAAEAAKKAADAANKKSWSIFNWGKSTPAAETTAIPAALATTDPVANK